MLEFAKVQNFAPSILAKEMAGLWMAVFTSHFITVFFFTNSINVYFLTILFVFAETKLIVVAEVRVRGFHFLNLNLALAKFG